MYMYTCQQNFACLMLIGSFHRWLLMSSKLLYLVPYLAFCLSCSQGHWFNPPEDENTETSTRKQGVLHSPQTTTFSHYLTFVVIIASHFFSSSFSAVTTTQAVFSSHSSSASNFSTSSSSYYYYYFSSSSYSCTLAATTTATTRAAVSSNSSAYSDNNCITTAATTLQPIPTFSFYTVIATTKRQWWQLPLCCHGPSCGPNF